MALDLQPFKDWAKENGLGPGASASDGLDGNHGDSSLREYPQIIGQPAAQSKNGQYPAGKSEKPMLILPSGDVSFLDAANRIFPVFAKTSKYFSRGRIPVELVRDAHGEETLVPLRPARLEPGLKSILNCGYTACIRNNPRSNGLLARKKLQRRF
jgi:hypothetical protein